MSKFYGVSFVILTLLNFIFLLIIFHYSNKKNETFLSGDSFSNKNTNSEIIIETKLGKIEGLRKKINSTIIDTFLSVPYAEKPIGELRFQPPKAKINWTENYKAFNWPNPCIQPDQYLQLYNHNFSEDCLYLNIWSPNIIDNKTLKPVLVLIHTGAFIFGSASETKYNGIFLSYYANIVVVTFNYRLNFYGFFYPPNNDKQIAANIGMLDQVAALKWIKDNIVNFNGDPEQITLIGQSSGALAAGMHIISPISQNLFSQAILMSGSPLQLIEFSEPELVKTFWYNYLKYLNCDKHNQINDTINCVDDKIQQNRQNLISMNLVKQFSVDKLFVNIPIVFDGYFHHRNFLDQLKFNSQKKNLSILFGYTNDEGSWILMLDDQKKFGPTIKSFLSYQQAISTSEMLLSKMLINSTQLNGEYRFYLQIKN